jgi:hypothetical protein
LPNWCAAERVRRRDLVEKHDGAPSIDEEWLRAFARVRRWVSVVAAVTGGVTGNPVSPSLELLPWPSLVDELLSPGPLADSSANFIDPEANAGAA